MDRIKRKGGKGEREKEERQKDIYRQSDSKRERDSDMQREINVQIDRKKE